jgi:hypothetical protein
LTLKEANRRRDLTYNPPPARAGIDIFTLARRMGTSVKMIDRTYGRIRPGIR